MPEAPPIRRVVFDEGQIQRRVGELGAEIAAHYPADEPLLLIGLLKGSFIFLADLARRIERTLEVDFLVASSYGAGTTSSGNVRLIYDPASDLDRRHVLLVEDIVDSGNTLNRLIPVLRARNPRSLEMVALLHKRSSGGVVQEPRWVGFDAPDEFLVGYGLDLSEQCRNLPYIASISFTNDVTHG